MNKPYFFLLFLYFIFYYQNTVYAQNKAYSEAFFEIEKMLKEDKYSFKKAVFLTENTYFDNKIEYSDFCNKINSIVFLCKKFSEANPIVDYNFKDRENIASWGAVFKALTDTIQAILPNNEKAYHLPFGYDFEDFFGEEDWTKTFVTKLLLTKKGNCHSLPYLYKILCEELGVSAHLALAPNHIYIKHHSEKTGWYNTELTSATFPIDSWLMASGYVHISAIQNGVYMKALSDKECVALCLIDLAEGYKRKTNYKDTDFILKCCEIALLHFPSCVNALLLKVETLKYMLEHPKNESSAEAGETSRINEKRERQFIEIQNLYLKIHDLGYRQIPQDMYFEWLLDLKTEKDKYLNKNIGGIKKK